MLIHLLKKVKLVITKVDGGFTKKANMSHFNLQYFECLVVRQARLWSKLYRKIVSILRNCAE